MHCKAKLFLDYLFLWIWRFTGPTQFCVTINTLRELIFKYSVSVLWNWHWEMALGTQCQVVQLIYQFTNLIMTRTWEHDLCPQPPWLLVSLTLFFFVCFSNSTLLIFSLGTLICSRYSDFIFFNAYYLNLHSNQILHHPHPDLMDMLHG